MMTLGFQVSRQRLSCDNLPIVHTSSTKLYGHFWKWLFLKTPGKRAYEVVKTTEEVRFGVLLITEHQEFT